MNKNGVTLIELMVVLAIAGILAVALGFAYIGWQGAYKVEKATKEIYSDLTDARGRAVTRNQEFFLRLLTARTYNMYADTNGNTTFEIATDAPQFATAKTVEYDMLWNNAAIGGGVTITLDRRGLMTNLGTIRLSTTADADYDCVIVAQSRINLGKWNTTTGVCDAK